MTPLAVNLLAWFPLVIVAMLNGLLREYLLAPHLPEMRAHQISSFTLIMLFSLYTWGLQHFWPLAHAQQAWLVGLVWLGLTIVFEFTFFHYVGGKSWAELWAAWRFWEGRLWVLVLLATLLLPRLMHSPPR